MNNCPFNSRISELLSKIPSRPKVHLFKIGGRSVLSLTSHQDKTNFRALARLIAAKCATELPNNYFGYARNMGIDNAIAKLREASQNQSHIVCDDICENFVSIDQKRLVSIIKKVKLNTRVFMNEFICGGRLVRVSGLATGLPTSPIFAALYLAPVIKRLNARGWSFIFYSDNFFGFVKSSYEGEVLRQELSECLRQHSYQKNQLKLKGNGQKFCDIIAPGEAVEALGVRIQNGFVFPIPKNGAAFFAGVTRRERLC